ncbi:orexin receptor type 2-like [Anoplophora glabripennis]|uniref:orexin receptor type 2-like n=1 Tax=Anoplophora glabripennis TaxID=217634 RepID=UPI000874DB10|nr:orexin receptor type 2-like [Anoplophora glabripennis]
MNSITKTLRPSILFLTTIYIYSSFGLSDKVKQQDLNDIGATSRDTILLSNNSIKPSRSNLEAFDNERNVINEIGIYSQNISYPFNGSFEEDDEDPTTEDFLEFIYPKSWTWALIFFHCIVFVVGLVGNCLVCVAVYRNHTMRTVTNYFIVNLAVADFLVILFCLPPSVVWDVTSTWWFGTAMCKIVLYLQILLSK